MSNSELRGIKKILRSFMQRHYSDERLAMLLAHAQEGKLAWYSCCCFIGITTADHALQGGGALFAPDHSWHLSQAVTNLHNADLASSAYGHLGLNDDQRRRRVIPMIRAEMRRRERAKAAPAVLEHEPVAV